MTALSKVSCHFFARQSKRERIRQLVREVASSSSDGISPDVWKECGAMLSSHDLTLQRQFDSIMLPPPPPPPDTSGGIDASGATTSSSAAMNQACSPWMWCEHCKLELREQKRLNGGTDVVPKHSFTHDRIPPILSQLPLPAPPLETPAPSASTGVGQRSQLLPMYPVPMCNDSDYEDLDITAASSSSSSGGAKMPSSQSGHPDPPPTIQSSNASTDDSGNASAGSISSFASVDGCGGDTASRTGSCDGESSSPPPPPPPPASSSSSWKSRFCKSVTGSGCHKIDSAAAAGKNCQQTSSASRANYLTGEVGGGAKSRGMPAPLNYLRVNNHNLARSPHLAQAKLYPPPPPHQFHPAYHHHHQQQQHDPLLMMPSLPYPHHPHHHHHDQQRRIFKLHHHHHQQQQRANAISDNDSDTGLSSLHSADSTDLFMYSETLV